MCCLPLGVFAQEATDSVPQEQAILVDPKPRQLQTDNYEQLTATPSSLDLRNPDNLTSEVEYDTSTGYYILHNKIGDIDVTTPYLMTPTEYLSYSEKIALSKYWQEKLTTVEHNNEKKFDITDMKFNIGAADKVFGPGGVRLKLQGSAELIFAFKHQYINNPALTLRARNNNIFDFDEKIQLNVNGSVGNRLNFTLNYNTEASFDFDQQNLKLAYTGQEDDILQSLEAGNVSMNLNSQLIRGSQALFGVKANLKFGKFTIQALISQQNSESQTVSSQGGAQTTPFEIKADHYDENRHFFLSHYFRDNYEKNMAQLPYIASGVTINRIEVWITNKRGQYDNARNLVAFADLGEHNADHINNAHWRPYGANDNPDNRANTLYTEISQLAGVRDIQQTNAVLNDYTVSYGLTGGEDFEKVESARLLSASEYTLNTNLGYISLRTSLNQDEVLCVAYEYTFNGKVYQVGEFSTDGSEDLKAPNALILKMLKSSSNAPDKKGKGTWDLMMKNVYSVGAMQMSQEKFELQIVYRNDSVGTDLQYLSEGQIKGQQLIRVMNLDRLDSKNNPHPDGKFDYVENYTAYSSNGRIIFPVLEPFGSHLQRKIGNDQIAAKYTFQELYDSTLVVAQEMAEKNKFVLTGKYKGSAGNEIRLNAMNVPRGSVTVTAGGATLVENVDYTVDYVMGTVTILNQSILDAGTNVSVKLENQSTFSMQRKSLMGAHLEYAFNPDFTLGGTIMYLAERPLTTKVNTGSEPLSNTIWGLNLNYKTDFMWLSNALDRIPWINATAPSTFQVNAEFAHLIPGHTREVGKAGNAYIDDFEATKTRIDIHYPNFWYLCSTPSDFPESTMSNALEYGKNRAHLAWFAVDPIFGHPQTNTPLYIKNSPEMLSDHRTRIVYEQEIYPNKEVLATEDTRLAVMNLSYYPTQRGPYNLVADDIQPDGTLSKPASRWGGIMRKLDNTDFETSNIEYIEFWIMDPFLTNPGADYMGGDLYFNLGDISEDILKDGKKAFEHGLPLNENDLTTTETTIWGRVPKTTSTVKAFSNETGARDKQDVGLNGLSTQDEFLFEYNGRRPYQEYVENILAKINPETRALWEADPYSPLNDPAGDNYHYYRGTDWDNQRVPILMRYKYFNGTEGNSPATESGQENYGTASTLVPDIEDINNDNTLNEYEKYFQYKVQLRPGMMEVGRQHITEKLVTKVALENGTTEEVTWYQFKIPIRDYDKRVGSIRNFKSIRFVRMYLTGFEQETHLRLASLDLVRGEWRSCTKDLYPIDQPPVSAGSMDVEAVNIEENASRSPVNYVLPPGISRQTTPGQVQIIAQNEQAMVLRVHNLAPQDARAVYKNTGYDMRNYKRLQMFVHAEALKDVPDLQDGDLSCFVRLGTDMTNNYYEYEVPLSLTPEGIYSNDNGQDRLLVWPKDNMIDFPFEVLTNAKLARNKAKRAGNTSIANNRPYTLYDEASGKPQNRVTVMGNPTLGEVENIMIGIRNRGANVTSGEVWVNELRMSEFNEEGGVAAMANVALGISDIAQVNVAGRLETAGYGSIESNVLDRNMDNSYQISVSAALEAGRLFPEQAKLQIPVYVAYTNETLSPKYDPLDSDVKLAQNLETYKTQAEKDSVKTMANTVQTSTNFSISNAKVNIHSKKRDMFYDPANFTLSYSYSEQNRRTPEMQRDYTKEENGTAAYAYNFNPTPWEPFKNGQHVQKLKWIKELNLYYLPQSLNLSMDMHRNFTQMRMRDLTGGMSDDPIFSKDWMWNRNLDLRWDLTKTLKFTFQTATNSTIDEGYYTPEIIKDYGMTNDFYEAWRDTVRHNIKGMGRPYSYSQVFTGSYTVPFNRFPWFDWMTATGTYNATYNWNRTVASAAAEDGAEAVDLGNVISSMASWQVDGALNFEQLYNKSKYLKGVIQRYNGRGNAVRRAFRPKTYTQTLTCQADSTLQITHRLGSENLEVSLIDEKGKKVAFQYKTTDGSTLALTPKKSGENLTLTLTTKDPNARTAAQVAGDIGMRFLLLVRKAQVTYRHTNSLTVPGFYPQIGFMGEKRMDNIYAPGFDFSFGFIDDDFIDKAKERHWLSPDTTVIQPATKATTSDFSYKVTLEPFPGFKIQVNAQRYAASSSSIIYSYDQIQENFTGSFNITQIALKTAFDKIGTAEQNFSSKTFDQFLANRTTFQNRLQAQYQGLRYPDAGFMENTLTAGQPYSEQNGKVDVNSADVLVPAFLAAYTGRDAKKMDTNPFLGLKWMLPNWNVTYDGLGRLPWMRDHFRSVNLTHAYSCKYTIGAYNSYSTWVPAVDNHNKNLGFVRDVATDLPLPSSAYDIASVNITESFSPLIGVNIAMKNSMTAKVEYRKQRNLTLNVNSVQLMEGATNELVIGFGYTIKNLNAIFKTKSGRQSKVSNDLKLNVDVSYKDIKTLLRKVEENITQASSGNKVLGIKVALDYVLSSKVNLQLFYDHQGTTPLISSSYPIKADNIGLNIKLMLTR